MNEALSANEAYRRRMLMSAWIAFSDVGKFLVSLLLCRARTQRRVQSHPRYRSAAIDSAGGACINTAESRVPRFSIRVLSHSWPDDRLSAFSSPIGQEPCIRADCRVTLADPSMTPAPVKERKNAKSSKKKYLGQRTPIGSDSQTGRLLPLRRRCNK